MSTCDNFTRPTKVTLAKRAGYRCSFPGCNANTIGPSRESAAATASTGEAAHISAASSGKGSRRYDAKLNSQQRRSIDNGIWCCNTHAQLIDTDETTYTVEMLLQWKALAEQRAQLRQAYGEIDFKQNNSLVSLGLAPDALSLVAGAELNQKLGIAVRNSCFADLFGENSASALRDFLIEHSRNALSHGRANSVQVEFHSDSIRVVDDGAVFSVSALAASTSSGGGLAYRALLALRYFGYVCSRRTSDNRNVVHIPIVANVKELPRVNPCAVELTHEMIYAPEPDFSHLSGCDRLFVIAPPFFSYSDGSEYERIVRQLLAKNPNVVLIFPHISEPVLEHFRELFPGAEVESW